MKLPRARPSLSLVLLIAGLYLLAAISVVKLQPWFSSLAMRSSRPAASISNSTAAGADELKDIQLPLQPGFSAIDFSDRDDPITVEIYPPHNRTPVKITFFTGETCGYENHRACVYTYQARTRQPVIFLTIHSGMDGEAEHFRHYLEGTGINRAAYTLKQVRAVLRDLAGAEVTLRQGSRAVTGLELAAVGRVPPVHLEDYFAAPFDRSLNVAAGADLALEEYVYPERPLLVIETCGWKMPGEKSSPAASDTTGSIYLAVIQARDE